MTERHTRARGRLALGLAFSTAIAGVAFVAAPVTAAADPAPDTATSDGPSIGKHDEQLLNQAKMQGDKTVTVIVSAKKSQGAQAAAQLTQAGAKVEYRADEIGYIRAEVPVDQVKKLTSLGAVSAVDLDENVPLSDPSPQGQTDPSPQPAPNATTPRVNPYMPTGDIKSAQFVNSHPEWDGRGTTVGVLDTGVDLGHPSLNTTSTGERKVTDWVTFTDPTFTNGVNNDDDPTWLVMSTPAVSGNSFTSGGSTYATPAAAADYRFGVFNERDPRLAGELGNDVNRDGNPAGSIGTFGVLWDPTTATVWVDTNQNKNFADDQAMTDYKVHYDVGHFGTDNPATAIAESMPYVVQTDKVNNTVNIGIVSGEHGSHVAGIIAGNKLLGGTMSGAAPGAKLVSVRVCLFISGCTNHALLEGMIYAARDAHVDVINMSIGGLPALNDGNNARAELYTSLIDTYGVQMFISAGNDGAGTNSIGDPAVADKVVSVGSYISKDSWRRNYGSIVNEPENMHPFSSRGPREDGGFAPTLIAPGSAISSIPTWMAGSPVAGTYDLPPGYAMLQGTSMASPQAAGAGALLVSAAKARNVQHSPAQLRLALTTTTKAIEHYQAFEQGNGLIDVNRAWALLSENIKPVDITSSVEVHTVLSGFLKTPGVGVGIYDREGVKAGDSFTREYTFTRTSGPNGNVTYKAFFELNDGTFSGPPTIVLPKNTPVKYKVTVHPTTSGIHSSSLYLDDLANSGIEFGTLNTVIAAEDFTAANGYTVSHSSDIGRNRSTSFYFRVPANTPAFKVDLQGGGTTPGAGQIRFLRYHPYGVHLESNQSPNCYNPPAPGGTCDLGDPTSRTLSNPTPGVWEVTVEARRTSDTQFAPFKLTASVLGATVSPNPDIIPTVAKGVPTNRSYTLTNSFGAFTGRAVGTTLGSARTAVPTIADGAQQQFQINVTPGSTQLRVKIGGTADPQADLDLALYNCTTGTCLLAAQSADADAEEEVTVPNPATGVWVALVVGFGVPAGTTTYNYLDVFTNPAFGSIAVADANAVRAGGSSWTVNGTVTANAAPGAGRVLLGNVQVRTDGDILVGTGDVIVQAVTG